jgi:hypothetical protein
VIGSYIPVLPGQRVVELHDRLRTSDEMLEAFLEGNIRISKEKLRILQNNIGQLDKHIEEREDSSTTDLGDQQSLSVTHIIRLQADQGFGVGTTEYAAFVLICFR